MDLSSLSRRERQIVQVIYGSDGATVIEICEQLPNPPTPMATRRMLAILLEKGFVRRRKQGREYVYLPQQSKQRAGARALKEVLQTYFEGSIGKALATHLGAARSGLSEVDVARLKELIDDLNAKRGE